MLHKLIFNIVVLVIATLAYTCQSDGVKAGTNCTAYKVMRKESNVKAGKYATRSWHYQLLENPRNPFLVARNLNLANCCQHD